MVLPRPSQTLSTGCSFCVHYIMRIFVAFWTHSRQDPSFISSWNYVLEDLYSTGSKARDSLMKAERLFASRLWPMLVRQQMPQLRNADGSHLMT